MKGSIKYVVVLCMLVAMLVPTTAFAAGSVDINELCSEKIDFYKSLCKSNFTVNQDKLNDVNAMLNNMMLKKECPTPVAKPASVFKQTRRQAPSNTVMPGKPANPSAKADPQKPSGQPKPEAPVKTQKPEAPVKPQNPETPAKPQKPNTQTENSGAPAGSYESSVVSLVNKERAAQGLPALKFNSKLSNVAEAKAADLRDKNYFSHTSPTYGSPFDMMKSFGISYTAAGENIAKGYKTPDAVMQGWMNSPGHKANILNSSFTEIGVGYVTDGSGTGYWVQMFIRP